LASNAALHNSLQFFRCNSAIAYFLIPTKPSSLGGRAAE
jgi:hypothetical protein